MVNDSSGVPETDEEKKKKGISRVMDEGDAGTITHCWMISSGNLPKADAEVWRTSTDMMGFWSNKVTGAIAFIVPDEGNCSPGLTVSWAQEMRIGEGQVRRAGVNLIIP